MSWSVIYLIIAIVAGVFGVWKIARRGNLFLGVAGLTWFLVVLFSNYVPDLYNLVIISGVPTFGRLLHFVALPVFLILASFGSYRR